MLLGFKTELKVNNTQRILLAKHAGVARHAWNWGLGLTKQILDNNRWSDELCSSRREPAEALQSLPCEARHALEGIAISFGNVGGRSVRAEGNRSLPHEKIKFPSAIDLHKWLVALVKPECPWYYEVSKCAPQYALRHLRRAWDDCFSKSKKPPRFKKKGKSDSFTLDGSITVEDRRIKVPRIGWLKTYEKLPSQVNPQSVTISKKANKWFISWKIEIHSSQIAPSDKPVSADLGLLRFATLSSGEEIHSPRPYKQLEKKLAKLQWRNRHKVIGSSSWKKAQSKIAKLHYRISCIRSDFLHKLTTYLAKNHSQIVIEDLCVLGLIKNRNLSKAISDSGWGEFRRQLKYKTELYGSELVVANRFFASSKLCPKCGYKKDELPLNVRVYECNNCKEWKADRDYTAAVNLLNLLGVANPEVIPVEVKTPKSIDEAGTNNQPKQDNEYVQLSLFTV